MRSQFEFLHRQWYRSYSLRAGSEWNCSSILILLARCQQTCMTYTTAVCTVKNSWWWTVELSETCRVLFQKLIREISASSQFYYMNSPYSFIACTGTTLHLTLPQFSVPIHCSCMKTRIRMSLFCVAKSSELKKTAVTSKSAKSFNITMQFQNILKDCKVNITHYYWNNLYTHHYKTHLAGYLLHWLCTINRLSPYIISKSWALCNTCS